MATAKIQVVVNYSKFGDIEYCKDCAFRKVSQNSVCRLFGRLHRDVNGLRRSVSCREMSGGSFGRSRISGFTGEYRWLSNFWKASVEYEGMVFPTVENAYQAAKVLDREQRHVFKNVKPAEAKRLGSKVMDRGDDWKDVNLGIMRHLVRQKFFRHNNLRRLLLGTGDSYIVEENNWGDKFWGAVNGDGENNLGQIIMGVREELRAGKA